MSFFCNTTCHTYIDYITAAALAPCSNPHVLCIHCGSARGAPCSYKKNSVFGGALKV